MQVFPVESSRKWDFRKADIKQYTHCFHIYPAKMIPQVARKLIKRYGRKNGMLFDPYCGAGTSLVEAKVFGMNSFGTDLNPTARFISRCKTRNYNQDLLNEDCKFFIEQLKRNLEENRKSDLRKWRTILKGKAKMLKEWYPRESIKEICTALDSIEEIKDEFSKNFIKVVLSECLRLISYQRNGEFKKYRIKKSDRRRFYVELLPLLQEKIQRNLTGVKKFIKVSRKRVNTIVFDFNTVDGIPEGLRENMADLVVTSPPYGDSRTTVAYGEFSWHTNFWLGLGTTNVDPVLMGGKAKTQIKKIGHSLTDKLISEIANGTEIEKQRAKIVYKFYVDYFKSIKNVAKSVKNNGYACYVVGNRTVKGKILPTDQFTAWAFSKHGFSHEKTIQRAISGKRLPGLVSPENKKGITTPTMKKEFIIIMKKN